MKYDQMANSRFMRRKLEYKIRICSFRTGMKGACFIDLCVPPTDLIFALWI